MCVRRTLMSRMESAEQNLIRTRTTQGSGSQLHVQAVHGLDSHAVVKVACGIGSSLVLTREGKVFLWGSALTCSRDFGRDAPYPALT